jgi:hypothetical protein
MSDEDDLGLARKALDGDAGALLRLIRSQVRMGGNATQATTGRASEPLIIGRRPSRDGRPHAIVSIRASPIYDRIALGRDHVYQFFAMPIGMVDPNSPSGHQAKTRADTSMVTWGRLPEPEEFEVRALTFVPFDCTADDIEKIRRGYFRLLTGGGQSIIAQWPTALLVEYGDPKEWHDLRLPEAVRVAPLLPRSVELAPSEVFLIGRNENFAGELCFPNAPQFSRGASLMLVLEGFHAVGVSRGC